VRVVIKNGDEKLFRKKFTKILASEMQIVKVKSDGPMSDVKIYVKKCEASASGMNRKIVDRDG